MALILSFPREISLSVFNSQSAQRDNLLDDSRPQHGMIGSHTSVLATRGTTKSATNVKHTYQATLMVSSRTLGHTFRSKSQAWLSASLTRREEGQRDFTKR